MYLNPSSFVSVLETNQALRSLSFSSILTKQLLLSLLPLEPSQKTHQQPAKSNRKNHEEGDHHPDSCELRQVPGQGHQSGGSGQGSGVRDAGRRRQDPAAGDRRRRGLQQAGEEAQEEGGRGGDRGAADARHVRAHGRGAPAPGDQAGAGDGDGRGAAVTVQQLPVQLCRRAHQPLLLPVLPVAGGGIRLRLRLRGRRDQQLLDGGGAQPPGQLLAAGREARPPAHGSLLLLLLQQAEAE